MAAGRPPVPTAILTFIAVRTIFRNDIVWQTDSGQKQKYLKDTNKFRTLLTNILMQSTCNPPKFFITFVTIEINKK